MGENGGWHHANLYLGMDQNIWLDRTIHGDSHLGAIDRILKYYNPDLERLLGVGEALKF